ncbi:MAG: SAF domain-containing protein [Gallionellaceae bacterium]
MRAIRPGLGLPTKYYDLLLGRKILCNAKKGTPVTWQLVL